MNRLICALLLATVGVAGPVQPAHAGNLRELKLLRLPDDDPTRSGSVAFDGFSIYYARSDGQQSSRIYRLDPRTGAERPSFVVDAPKLWEMTYDGKRNHLYVVSTTGDFDDVPEIYDVDLADFSSRKLFDSPDELTANSHWSYDASFDGFVVSTECYGCYGGGTACVLNCPPPPDRRYNNPMLRFSRSGEELEACELPSGIGSSSTIVAAGDGTAYIQSEDDETLYHVSRTCKILGSGKHPHYDESDENDSMACDTITFPVPAVWIRDGTANAIHAFEVPGGYCPLPTKMAPVVGKDVIVGTKVTICTRLSLANLAYPLAHQPVTLFGEGAALATVTTDAGGRACTGFVPRKVGPNRLSARFPGSRAYVTSSNIGSLKGLPVPVKPVRRRPAAVTIEQPQQQTPRLAPKPVPLPQIQTQTVTQVQTQPHLQPQIQAQAVVVPQVQEQVQVAHSTVDSKQRDLAFSRFSPRRRTPVPGPLLPLAGGVVAVAGMCLVLRPAASPARAPAPARARVRARARAD